jgi:lipoyl synthase
VTLRARWLGRVPYREAHALQHALFDAPAVGHLSVGGSGRPDDWLLLLEHPPTYTLGVRADPANVLVAPADLGAELVRTDRGGDVTFHGPGQLVGYPIVSLPGKRGGGMADTVAYVHSVEQLVIDAVTHLGLTGVGRLPGYPGVWVDPDGRSPRKLAAVGVRLTRGRTMHGFALNVDTDLGWFDHIVPCGIADKAVTSLAAEGIDAPMDALVDAIVAGAGRRWGPVERQDVVWRRRPDDLAAFSRRAMGEEVPVEVSGPTTARRRLRLAEAGLPASSGVGPRKPEWLRVPAQMGPAYLDLKRTIRRFDLTTVCEEAGCPNIYDCWADGTATFMLNGERCTRACGFCLVDTRHPEPADPGEPGRVAETVEHMGLRYVVLTAVARDDLDDGGASGFAATIHAIRDRVPGAGIEVLIPDCKGEPDALATVFEARPDVLNHNIETVPRLQRAVRPSAGYARSLAVLARAKAAGLTTKSGLMVGLGETEAEVEATLADLHGVGVDIVTIGQYLRPTSSHLPVARWWTPEEFDRLRRFGEDLGLGHVESSPLTRSSYHASGSADRVGATGGAGATAAIVLAQSTP